MFPPSAVDNIYTNVRYSTWYIMHTVHGVMLVLCTLSSVVRGLTDHVPGPYVTSWHTNE